MVAAAFLLACVTLACAGAPSFVSYFYQATPPGFRLNGFPFVVPVTMGNQVVCGLNIRGKPITGSKTIVVVDGERLSPIVDLQFPPNAFTANGTLVVFFSKATVSPMRVVANTFAGNPTFSATGELHCMEVSGATGMDGYGYGTSIFSGTIINSGPSPKNLCSDTLFVTTAVSTSLAAAVSVFGTLQFAAQRRGGMAFKVQSDPPGTSTITSAVFPGANPPPGFNAIATLVMSGCTTATASSCLPGANCTCGGSYCVTSGTGGLPVAVVDVSTYSKVLVQSDLVLQPGGVANMTLPDQINHMPLLASLAGSITLNGTLTITASPPSLASTRTAIMVQAPAVLGQFDAIAVVSLDPCFAIQGVPAYAGSSMSITLSATAVPQCGAVPTCATMSPTCAHGTCTDTAGSPTCLPCPSDPDGFGFSGTFCEILQCPLACSGAARGTCLLVSPALVPECSCVAGQWTGRSCETPICTPTCQNGAICIAQIPPVCLCVGPWQGLDCFVPLVNQTCPLSCGVGTCSVATNFSCSCPSGYSGNACQIFSCPQDCSSNGACLAVAGGPPECNCSALWTGLSCEQRQCVAGDCLNGGQCVPLGTAVSCNCPETWSGAQCQLPKSAQGALSTGDIVGIAVGATVLGVVLAVAIVLISRHVQKKNTQNAMADIHAKELNRLRAATTDYVKF